MKNTSILLLTFFVLFILTSCREQSTTEEKFVPQATVKTAPIIQGDIENSISMNGKIIYLKKNTIVAPIAGYITALSVKYGDRVQKNDVLFEIQTKENKALENTHSVNGNMGNIKVLASSSGLINELIINETGAYVVEGDVLCSIVENNDLMVQVNVPFEYNALMRQSTKCEIFLADHSCIKGSVYKVLPLIDELNQTQNVLIKLDTYRSLPENLNLNVQFLNEKHSLTTLVPKEAVMANETQSEFWVMKVIDGNMAVIIPILKGIENDSIVEIFSSDLNINDLVISEGAFGLPDSTLIRIVK